MAFVSTTFPRGITRLPSVFEVLTFGQNPDDDEGTRRLKAMSVVVVLVMTVMSASMMITPGRSDFLLWLDAIIVLTELHGLWWYWRLRTTKTLFYTIVPAYFAFIACSATINGTAEGDHYAIMLIPSAALIILGPNRALWWLGAAVIVLVGNYLMTPYYPNWAFESVKSVTHPSGSLWHSAYKELPTNVEIQTTVYATCIFFFMSRSAYLQLMRALDQVKEEKAKTDALMNAVYPPSIADRLKRNNRASIADEIETASVLFADLEGFSRLSKQCSPRQLITLLDDLFNAFDALAEQHGVEKIKTMGDGYLAASGVLAGDRANTEALCAFGLDMIQTVEHFSQTHGVTIGLRVGIHSGHVIAGVMGSKRPHFDIWGGTVNMAHRLQATAPRNAIQMTAQTKALVSDTYLTVNRGNVEMKGIGNMPCWTIQAQNTEAAA